MSEQLPWCLPSEFCIDAYPSQVVDAIIAQRRPASPRETDLVSLLLAARHPQTGAPLSTQDVRDEILIFLVAGHETPSNALPGLETCLVQVVPVLRSTWTRRAPPDGTDAGRRDARKSDNLVVRGTYLAGRVGREPRRLAAHAPGTVQARSTTRRGSNERSRSPGMAISGRAPARLRR